MGFEYLQKASKLLYDNAISQGYSGFRLFYKFSDENETVTLSLEVSPYEWLWGLRRQIYENPVSPGTESEDYSTYMQNLQGICSQASVFLKNEVTKERDERNLFGEIFSRPSSRFTRLFSFLKSRQKNYFTFPISRVNGFTEA